MCCEKVKEETEDRIVLVDNVVKNVLGGLIAIVSGLLWCSICISIFADLEGGLLHTIIWLFMGLFAIIVGGFLVVLGLGNLVIKESVIIDKQLQTAIIKQNSFIKYLKSIKKYPFSLIKEIEITYDTECYGCDVDYDSPANDPADSWKIALISIHGDFVLIYYGDYNAKSKTEEIAEKICKITDKKVTHRSVVSLYYGE